MNPGWPLNHLGVCFSVGPVILTSVVYNNPVPFVNASAEFLNKYYKNFTYGIGASPT